MCLGRETVGQGYSNDYRCVRWAMLLLTKPRCWVVKQWDAGPLYIHGKEKEKEILPLGAAFPSSSRGLAHFSCTRYRDVNLIMSCFKKIKQASPADCLYGQLAHLKKWKRFRRECNKAQESGSMKGMTFICNHGWDLQFITDSFYKEPFSSEVRGLSSGNAINFTLSQSPWS